MKKCTYKYQQLKIIITISSKIKRKFSRWNPGLFPHHNHQPAAILGNSNKIIMRRKVHISPRRTYVRPILKQKAQCMKKKGLFRNFLLIEIKIIGECTQVGYVLLQMIHRFIFSKYDGMAYGGLQREANSTQIQRFHVSVAIFYYYYLSFKIFK